MKKFLLLFFLALSTTAIAQEVISGVVRDRDTGSPLPFSNIVTDTEQGTITDAEGKFEIENPEENIGSLTISYIGYSQETISVSSEEHYYTIQLSPSPQRLQEVVVRGGENPAIDIMRKTLKNRKRNMPEKKLESFSFKAYNRLLVTANPDSISGRIDSIYKEEKGKKIFVKPDSTNYLLKKELSRSHLYLSEKVSEYRFNTQKGKRETVLATKMAGFREPLYEILAIQMQSFSFYDNHYAILGTKYPGPVTPRAFASYHYKLLDTVVDKETGRPAYMIHYYPKEKRKTAGIEGVLYIDTLSYAMQKGIAQLKAIINIDASQTFHYFPEQDLWFPASRQIKIIRGKNQEGISLLGVSFTDFGKKQEDSTNISTRQDISRNIHFISREENFDYRFNIPLTIKGKGIAMEIEDNAHLRTEDYWNGFRRTPLTQRGQQTYEVLDSVVRTNNAERKINLARKLIKGYYPLKYVDLDLRYLLKYNSYEGFRVGMGAVTNTDFSSKYRLKAYAVYGTKDKKIKFGVEAAARLAKISNTWIGLSYMDDLVETGGTEFISEARSFSLFEPRLFNITMFHKTRRSSAFLEHDITAKIGAKLRLSQSNIIPAYNYFYLHNGASYHHFKLTEATLALQWNPFSRYMQTRHGKATMKNEYPNFTVQVTRAMSNLLEGDFDFTKIDFRGVYEYQHPNRSKTSLLATGGLAYGDLPITQLYQASPNQPGGEAILQRFSVAGRNSLETMYFNEFYSDRYLMLQLKHQTNRFKIVGPIKPELVLISRFALGSVTHSEKHIGINVQSFNKGYLESGFELNKIFKGFGLSAMYRYGAYQLPRFDENISFKFTYYMSLGF
ncbi:DUF5686 and carboxypeptidase-like regulatory domain-containing protein [Sinomicrobium sp.]